MRENRSSGSEGGVALIPPSLPLSHASRLIGRSTHAPARGARPLAAAFCPGCHGQPGCPRPACRRASGYLPPTRFEKRNPPSRANAGAAASPGPPASSPSTPSRRLPACRIAERVARRSRLPPPVSGIRHLACGIQPPAFPFSLLASHFWLGRAPLCRRRPPGRRRRQCRARRSLAPPEVATAAPQRGPTTRPRPAGHRKLPLLPRPPGLAPTTAAPIIPPMPTGHFPAHSPTRRRVSPAARRLPRVCPSALSHA